MDKEIGVIVIMVLIILLAYLSVRIFNLKRKVKENNALANVWLSLLRNSLYDSLEICRSNPSVVVNVQWDIGNHVCRTLFERIEGGQSSEFENDLLLYSDKEKIPSVLLRDTIVKTLEQGIVNFAEKDEKNKQKICTLYSNAKKFSNRRVRTFIHETIILSNIISMEKFAS